MRSFLGFVCLLAAPCVFGATTYSYWEGNGVADTQSVDITDAGDVWWANHYTRQVGGEAIASVTMAFGPNLAGLGISFIIYHDPNGDGLANDLVYLGHVNTTIPAFEDPIGANDFVTALFGTPIDVGPSFFVAALIMNAPDIGLRVDATNGQNQAWIAVTETADAGTFDMLNPNAAGLPPTNLTGFGINGRDFILMAEGVEGPGLADIPEPSSVGLMLSGLAALGLVRRKMQRS